MKTLAQNIERTIDEYAPLIRALDVAVLEYKPAPARWSKKEILGHLLDSAQNNIQRFIRAQYEDTPRIIYDQNEWVRIQAHQEHNAAELIELWVLLNKHLCTILAMMDPAQYDKQCDTGKSAVELHTLKFLAEDYLAHMMHHLKQIIPAP
jgi:hypothetical protein